MSGSLRRFYLFTLGIVTVVALVWASTFEEHPPAEFAIHNGDDVKTLDPARATGSPEGRVLDALFEGLLRLGPGGPPDPQTGMQPMKPLPGMSELPEISSDGKTYTFRIRPGMKWSDGTPLTSYDFAWSWQRMLHPETATEYGVHLYHVVGAEAYNKGWLDVGDPVEVELWDRPGETSGQTANHQPFPRGTMRYGILRRILHPPQPPDLPASAEDDSDEEARLRYAWQDSAIYVVDVRPRDRDGNVLWDAPLQTRRFCKDPSIAAERNEVTRVHQVLFDFENFGGVSTPDPRTLIVRLRNNTPYFKNLVAFYALYPVKREVIERYGSPLWTKAENIVSNGPYRLVFRRIRDRVRVEKNPYYWGADQVSFETVDFFGIVNSNTALNMYESGQLDWVTLPPVSLMEDLVVREDFRGGPYLSCYYYVFNCTQAPFDDVRVRRAFALAIDREQIVREVMKAGQLPAYSLIPPGMPGYDASPLFEYDPEEARRLLASAGYPDGSGFPKQTILYNTSESHRAVAEVVQQQLRNALNVEVGLQNMEWGTFLDKINLIDYQIARRGWIADYPDPNAMLELWVKDGPNNSTGWHDPRFESLLKRAAEEQDPDQRMKLLRTAEELLIEAMPLIPFHFYVAPNLVKSDIRGFFPNLEDRHPIVYLSRRTPAEE